MEEKGGEKRYKTVPHIRKRRRKKEDAIQYRECILKRKKRQKR